MKSLIDKFSELSKAKITKAKLPDIQQAITDATDLLANSEPTETTEDAVVEFDDAVSTLESALDEAQMACDDFENAEEKDERDDALDTLDSALTDIHAALKTLEGVATVSEVSYDEVEAQIGEDFAKQVQSQPGKFQEALKVWLAADDKPEWRYKRKHFLEGLLAAVQNNKPSSPQTPPGTT